MRCSFICKEVTPSDTSYLRAHGEARTRDNLLGRQELYQLSYVRMMHEKEWPQVLGH